jgi:hypothetical protein
MRPSSNPRLVSPEERESFANCHDAGLTLSEIAAALQAVGYPARSFFGYVAISRRLGLGLLGKVDYDRPWTDDEDFQLRAYADGVYTARVISSRLYRRVRDCASRAKVLDLHWPTDGRRRDHEPKAATLASDVLALAVCRPWGPATKPGHQDLGRPAL